MSSLPPFENRARIPNSVHIEEFDLRCIDVLLCGRVGSALWKTEQKALEQSASHVRNRGVVFSNRWSRTFEMHANKDHLSLAEGPIDDRSTAIRVFSEHFHIRATEEPRTALIAKIVLASEAYASTIDFAPTYQVPASA